MASSAFLTTLTKTCSICAGRWRSCRDGAPRSPSTRSRAAVHIRRASTPPPAASACRSQGPRCGGGRRTTSAKLRISAPSCSVRVMTTRRAVSKSAPCSGGSSGRVVEAGMQQRAGRADRVVDLVGHHADELLVGGLFDLAQLLGQLFDQEEAAGEAPVEEGAAPALHPTRRRAGDRRGPGPTARLGQRANGHGGQGRQPPRAAPRPPVRAGVRRRGWPARSRHRSRAPRSRRASRSHDLRRGSTAAPAAARVRRAGGRPSGCRRGPARPARAGRPRAGGR